MIKYPTSRIALFAKAPEPGKVKTRLLPGLSAEQAAVLYEELLEGTLTRLADANLAPIDLWCAPDTTAPAFQRLAERYDLRLRQQVEGDLGVRMRVAVDQTLAEAGNVILIGGDCPVLTATHLDQALSWLQKGVDAVLGPAEDGGYVMLGLGRSDKALFNQIPWGGDQVLGLTRERLGVLDWEWCEIETLWDLDRPEDLIRYRRL